MKLMSHIKRAALGLACVGLLVPSADVLAAGPSKTAPAKKTTQVKASATTDVALQKQGTVVGRLFDNQGNPVKGSRVEVYHRGHLIARTATRQDGGYRVQGLRGGLHQIVTDKGHMVVRLWSENNAPPTARKQLISLAAGSVVRAQDAGIVYMDACPQPCPTCPPCGPTASPGFGAIDVITLGTVGLAAGALVVAIDNNNQLDDIENQLNQLQQSP